MHSQQSNLFSYSKSLFTQQKLLIYGNISRQPAISFKFFFKYSEYFVSFKLQWHHFSPR